MGKESCPKRIWECQPGPERPNQGPVGRHWLLLEIPWLPGSECPGLVCIGPQAPPVPRLLTGDVDATNLLAISTRSH